MADRQVRAVFANYRRRVTLPNGSEGVGMAIAHRGGKLDTETLAAGELERLERNGALMPVGSEVPSERLEEALFRALNPLDVAREDFGAPQTVAPPPLGARPVGDFTTGDTGIDPADQPPSPAATTLLTVTSEEQAALDRLRAASDGDDLPRSDAPDVEDTAALSEFIASERLNVAETVALAEDDPDRARCVLAAEESASGQDPRKGVADALQKIIDG